MSNSPDKNARKLEKLSASKKRGNRGKTRGFTHEEDFSILEQQAELSAEDEEENICEFCLQEFDPRHEQTFKGKKSCKSCKREIDRMRDVFQLDSDFSKIPTTRKKIGDVYTLHIRMSDDSFLPLHDDYEEKYVTKTNTRCIFCNDADSHEIYKGHCTCLLCSNFITGGRLMSYTIETHTEVKLGKEYTFYVLHDRSYILK